MIRMTFSSCFDVNFIARNNIPEFVRRILNPQSLSLILLSLSVRFQRSNSSYEKIRTKNKFDFAGRTWRDSIGDDTTVVSNIQNKIYEWSIATSYFW